MLCTLEALRWNRPYLPMFGGGRLVAWRTRMHALGPSRSPTFRVHCSVAMSVLRSLLLPISPSKSTSLCVVYRWYSSDAIPSNKEMKLAPPRAARLIGRKTQRPAKRLLEAQAQSQNLEHPPTIIDGLRIVETTSAWHLMLASPCD
jgi:hypothetical protein